MTQNVTNAVDHFSFSMAALENIEECDVDALEDLAKVKCGLITRESLLLACLDGAEDDRVEGWRDYVSEICRVADI